MSEFPDTDCIDWGSSPCDGKVDWWEGGTVSGYTVMRCEAHGARAIERDEERRSNYPDSPVAPAWFDPEFAGERWDSDY